MFPTSSSSPSSSSSSGLRPSSRSESPVQEFKSSGPGPFNAPEDDAEPGLGPAVSWGARVVQASPAASSSSSFSSVSAQAQPGAGGMTRSAKRRQAKKLKQAAAQGAMPAPAVSPDDKKSGVPAKWAPASGRVGEVPPFDPAAAARARDFIASFGVLPRGGIDLRNQCYDILLEAMAESPACIHQPIKPGAVMVEDVARALGERMGGNRMSRGAAQQFHLAVGLVLANYDSSSFHMFHCDRQMGLLRGALRGAAFRAPADPDRSPAERTHLDFLKANWSPDLSGVSKELARLYSEAASMFYPLMVAVSDLPVEDVGEVVQEFLFRADVTLRSRLDISRCMLQIVEHTRGSEAAQALASICDKWSKEIRLIRDHEEGTGRMVIDKDDLFLVSGGRMDGKLMIVNPSEPGLPPEALTYDPHSGAYLKESPGSSKGVPASKQGRSRKR